MTEVPAPELPLDRVAIWGVGLMGGSLGMALRWAGAAREVVGIGRDRRTLRVAQELGAVDRWETDPEAGMAGAQLLVLGAPVRVIRDQAAEWGPRVPEGCVVTDLGSTKAEVVAAWEAHIAPGAAFVGSHPMAGSERAGVRAARPDLYRGARWVITPTPATPPWAAALVARVAEAVGARVLWMPPDLHDRRVAYVSHLPQIVATATAAAAQKGDEAVGWVMSLAAGGFRDTTRVAASPVYLWQDILLTNRDPVLAALADFREALDGLEAAVRAGDPEGIARWFSRAHEARSRLAL
ncbi:prephenate dehydrogenase [Caldinitratiruptor microaerophilus]|uniref:prephenate dehydrogenase n=1 Tax=Caldinitratiruptor microaerophilus TaxID=671077 RepID=UPI0022301718|nr:prephenate dehydrogenase/arogenate dehydrogenase family protein [Caldinitratiruptor microaerophilus]